MITNERLDDRQWQNTEEKVKLNKPFRLSTAESKRKKFSVYVKNKATGNVKKVTFGARGMSIKKNIPARQKSFLARMGGVFKE